MIIIKEDSKVSEIQSKVDKILANMDKRMDRVHKLESKEVILANKIRALGIEVPEYEKFSRSKYAKAPNSMGHWRYDEFSDHILEYFDRDVYQNDSAAWDAIFDLKHNLQEQASSWNKYFDLEDKLTNLKTKLQQAQVRQQEVDEIHEVLRQLKDEIYNSVLENLMSLRETVWQFANELRQVPMREYAKRKEMLAAFAKRYGVGTYDRLVETTDAQLEKEANKTAESYVLNLIARVTKSVGTITDYSGVHISGPSINGVITGERGKVRVETIMAGGWNIQCLHYRVLIHKL